MGVLLRFRIDEELRRSAEQVTNEMGLTLEEAVHLFLKQMVKQGELPFKIKADAVHDDILPAFKKRAKHLDSFYED